jgi:N,N-dimethylformamidase
MTFLLNSGDYIVRPRGDNVTAPLTGYADRISVRTGETIAFKVSSHGSGPFSANLVRIVCGDPNPAGPGPTFEDHSSAFAGRFPSRVQHARPGSYAIAAAPSTIA